MRIKPNKATIGILAGALALVCLATGGILWAQNQHLTTNLKIAEAREIEVADGQKRERRREEALENLETDRERLRFLESAVSNAAYVPTLLKQLEEVAVQTQNRVLGVQPSVSRAAPNRIQQRRDPEAQEKGGEGGSGEKKDEPKEEPYTPLTIQVTLIGGYKSTQAFLERLTQFPKIVAVEEMQLRPHQSTDSKPQPAGLLDVQIQLTAFVMKEKPAASPEVTASAAVGGTQP